MIMMVYLTKEQEKKSSLQLRFLASDDRGQKMNRKKMMKAIIEYKLLVFFSLIFFFDFYLSYQCGQFCFGLFKKTRTFFHSIHYHHYHHQSFNFSK